MKNDKIIDVYMDDPTPTDTAAYREYVARVAGFHVDVMRPKFRHMISQTLHTLGDSENSDVDPMLKGSVYVLKEILLWGDEMVKKQTAFASGNDVTAEDKKDN